MTLLKSVIISTALVGLSACTTAFSGNNEVEKLQMTTPGGSPFTQQLATEYKAFSSYELNQEKDYADALHFSRKGISAAEGVNVMPEPVNDWDLNAAEIVELSEGYRRMVSALNRGAREIIPGKAAIAQARYDCWIEEQEEVSQGGQPSGCKADYLNAIAEVEAALPAAAPQPMAAAAEEFPAPVTMLDNNDDLNIAEALYLVFFDFDKSNINAGASDVLQTVSTEMQSRNIDGIHIVGHTDTSGSAAYNEKLSMRRANAIKSELISMGIPANAITTGATGENDLLVETQDGIREPANRRGVITFK